MASTHPLSAPPGGPGRLVNLAGQEIVLRTRRTAPGSQDPDNAHELRWAPAADQVTQIGDNWLAAWVPEEISADLSSQLGQQSTSWPGQVYPVHNTGEFLTDPWLAVRRYSAPAGRQ